MRQFLVGLSLDSSQIVVLVGQVSIWLGSQGIHWAYWISPKNGPPILTWSFFDSPFLQPRSLLTIGGVKGNIDVILGTELQTVNTKSVPRVSRVFFCRCYFPILCRSFEMNRFLWIELVTGESTLPMFISSWFIVSKLIYAMNIYYRVAFASTSALFWLFSPWKLNPDFLSVSGLESAGSLLGSQVKCQWGFFTWKKVCK